MTAPRLAGAARVEIDLDAFRANVRSLVDTVAPAQVMLAVKANAYGHGLLPMSRAALEAGATWLGVLEIAAGLELRHAGIEVPLFAWLHGVDSPFGLAVRHSIDLGVSSLDELEAIATAAREETDRGTGLRAARVHLKIDTGLHRNGCRPEDWPALVGRALELREQVRVVGILSHLADASPEADAEALARFRAAVEVARSLGAEPEVLHLAASSAGIREPEARFDLVRFGIAAYGVSPFDDADARAIGMRPPMTLRTAVVDADATGSVVGIGSADGVQPPGAGRAEVLVVGRGRRRVLEIDVDRMRIERADGDQPGDEVVVFGPGDGGEPTAEDWARWSDTIGDEILARAGERLPHVYLHEHANPVVE